MSYICDWEGGKKFLSTPSAGRATLMMYGLQPTAANFYPRPPRGGRQQVLFERRQKELISIHALRKEGDEPVFCRYRRRQGFLSTPSARRATRQSHYGHCQHEISIHALRKEGDPAGVNPTRKGEHFYPRPPQGGRPAVRSPKGTGAVFLSTPSARRATCRTGHVQVITAISIHALRKEGDLLVLFQIPPI